jgi:hypothetical protein
MRRHRASSVSRARGVVADEPQLALRPELEVFLVKKSRGDGVAAGDEFHQSFGQLLALINLDR